MVSNSLEMEPKRNIFAITDEVTAARNTKDQEKERAATLEFIDHILTGKENECANLNRCGPKVFPYPNYRWQKFSPSCPSCNATAMENLKKWRNNFLPNKPEILMGSMWDFEAGQVMVDPIGAKATIKGFAQDRTAVVMTTEEGKDIRLNRQEFNTYKVFTAEPPVEAQETAVEESQPVVTANEAAASSEAQEPATSEPPKEEAPATGKAKSPKKAPATA